LFFHKLSAFLDYSNHKQFFLYKAFASIISAPPLRKILAAPLPQYEGRSGAMPLSRQNLATNETLHQALFN